MAKFLKIPQSLITSGAAGAVYLNTDLIVDIRVNSTTVVQMRMASNDSNADVYSVTFSLADAVAQNDFINQVVRISSRGKIPPSGQYELTALPNSRTVTVGLA